MASTAANPYGSSVGQGWSNVVPGNQPIYVGWTGSGPPPNASQWRQGTSQVGQTYLYNPDQAVPLGGSYQPPTQQYQTVVPANPITGVQYGYGSTQQVPVAPTLSSGPVSGYNPAYGGVPSVPNPISTQGYSLGGNIGNLGQLSQLGLGLGGLNASLGSQPYQQNLPNYSSLLGAASGNALSNLQGLISTPEINAITQTAAERGIGTGGLASPAASTALLAALGETAAQKEQLGMQQFGQLVGATPTGPQFNPSSLLVTPEQQQAAQQLQNVYGSAPIPSAANAAALSALQGGISQGRGAGVGGYGFPTQSADLVGQILNRYAPTVGGTPSPGYPGTVNPNAVAYTSSLDPTTMTDEELFNYISGTQGSASDFLGNSGSNYAQNMLSPDQSPYYPDYQDVFSDPFAGG